MTVASVSVNGQAISLDTTLSLDNTPNTSNVAASADTVSFGDSGFAFHVDEGASASADIYAVISDPPATSGPVYTLKIVGIENVSSGGFVTTLNIDGTKANQAVSDTGTISPFAGVSIADSYAGLTQTLTVALSAAANGTFTNLGGGIYDAATGVYTVTGTAAAVDAALEALTFNPTLQQVPPGKTVTTNFTITDTDAYGATNTNNSTNVVTTAAPSPTNVGFDGDQVSLSLYEPSISPGDLFGTAAATVVPGITTFPSFQALNSSVVAGSIGLSGAEINFSYPASTEGVQ